jgi:hypothetical protein
MLNMGDFSSGVAVWEWRDKARPTSNRSSSIAPWQTGRNLEVFILSFFALNLGTLIFSRHIMFCDKDTHFEDGAHESGERLLAEEEGALWKRNEDSSTPTCRNFATALLQLTILVLMFLVGTLFGFHWRGDLDGLCSKHVSQYCKEEP